MSDPYVTSDAAYVLGLLDDADRAAYERHLVGCTACRERVAALRPLGPALARTSADDLTVRPALPPVPDTLLPALVRRVRAQRRRRRLVLGGATAAVAAGALAVVVAVGPDSTPPTDTASPSPSSALTALVDVPVQASATLSEEPWGTAVVLDCRYGARGGYGSGGQPTTYGLRVVDVDGRAYPLGTWSISPGESMTFRSGVAVPPDRIDVVEVVRPGGAAVLRLDRG